ncbi:MAG: glycosyltransferase [Bacteroidales bacterium]|nr:glycosyltransferase [Bacteroidales bacterium]
MHQVQQPEILISPLNWGLGHATRCIPIIRLLLSHNSNVTIATSGRALALLKNEFPQNQFIDLPGFSPLYPKSGFMVLKMFLLIPSFLFYLVYENYRLSKIIKLQKFDLIISDNRYGIFNRKVKSILITHQIRIQVPQSFFWMRSVLLLINRILMKPFDQIWIPDYNGNKNLSGALSHKVRLPSNAVYIGPLSRFKSIDIKLPKEKDSILAILSGQEPQRSILEQKILHQLKDTDRNIILIRGKSEGQKEIKKFGSITMVSFALAKEIEQLIRKSALIICRPGYSSIMDLAVLGGKVLFIPTPGQTEQEYLAEFFMQQGIALSVAQNKLNLREDIHNAILYKGFTPNREASLLEAQVDLLMNSLK